MCVCERVDVSVSLSVYKCPAQSISGVGGDERLQCVSTTPVTTRVCCTSWTTAEPEAPTASRVITLKQDEEWEPC